MPTPTQTAPTPSTPSASPDDLAVGGPVAPRGPTGGKTAPAPASAPNGGLATILTVTQQALGSVVSSVATQVGGTVKPAAVVAVASTFGFPIALMVAVLAFLAVQHRLDARDPKLRAAPLTAADSMLAFTDEELT